MSHAQTRALYLYAPFSDAQYGCGCWLWQFRRAGTAGAQDGANKEHARPCISEQRACISEQRACISANKEPASLRTKSMHLCEQRACVSASASFHSRVRSMASIRYNMKGRKKGYHTDR